MDKPANIARDDARYERIKAERDAEFENSADGALNDAIEQRILPHPNPVVDPHGLLSAIDDLVEQMNDGEQDPSPGVGR